MTKPQNIQTLKFNLSEAEIEWLNYERYAYPYPMIQKRILAVYIRVLLNYNYQTIGLIAGLHPNTVGHWIQVYAKEGLLPNNYVTNQRELEDMLKVFKPVLYHCV